MEYIDFCLKYFENFAKLKTQVNISDELGTSILQLGKMREYQSHPKGDMNIILRYCSRTESTPSQAIEVLINKKCDLSFTK